jgi:prepilin-type N-terminal cleavage/methylation domain-containing protein
MLINLWRRALDARGSGDAGVTLTELIVAMTLSAILGAMTLMLFVQVNSAASGTNDRTINTSSARNAIQAWTSYLRVADGPTAGSSLYRFEWITPGDLMFHANLYNRATSGAGVASTSAGTMVWLRIDSAGALIEEQFPATAAINTNPSVCRILMRKASAATLFAPFDTRGIAMTGQNLGTAATVGTGCQKLPVTVPSLTSRPDAVAVANLQNVTTIVIDFTVSDTKNTRPLEFTSQATMPILGGSL